MATTGVFGWEIPDDNDYVAQGYAAIDTLGTSVDITLAVISGSAGGGDVPKLALDYITQATIGSGVSSFTVSNCFSSKYDNYKIIVSNTTGGANDNVIRIAVNGTTGSNYNGGYTALQLSTGGLSGGPAVAATSIPLFLTSTNKTSFSCDVIAPNIAAPTSFINGSSTGYNYILTGSTGYTLTSDVSTGFTLTSTTTLTGGTIRVYGYRNN